MPGLSLCARRPRAIASISVALLVAGCSDAPTSVATREVNPSTASFSQSSQSSELNGGPGNAHIMHTLPWFANDHAQNAAGGGGSNTAISYHGGPVLLAGPNVAAVYWSSGQIYNKGPAVGSAGPGSLDGSLIGFFLRNLGPSSYFNINSGYTNGSGAHIANSVSYTQYWANGTNAPTGTQKVTDAQMLSMLQSGFASGALHYDPSTLYAIFTAGSVNLGGGFGTQYCAYHSWGNVMINGVSTTVLYAAMPYDFAYPSACTSGFKPANGSMDPGADYEVNTLAHETEETTTDMQGSAWFDRRGFENADKCAWTWGTTHTTAGGGVWNITIGGLNFLVQRNWLVTGNCASSLP